MKNITEPITLSPQAFALVRKFFAEGKIQIVGLGDHQWQASEFIAALGYRPYISASGIRVTYTLSQRMPAEEQEVGHE